MEKDSNKVVHETDKVQYCVNKGVGHGAPCLTICWYSTFTSEALMYSPRSFFRAVSRLRML